MTKAKQLIDQIVEGTTLKQLQVLLKGHLSKFATVSRLSAKKLGIDGVSLSELQAAVEYVEKKTGEAVDYQTGNKYEYEIWFS